MIHIENLTKYYGKNCAVNNISFDIAEGQVVGFLGPNGAGKSTTMNILTGYLSSTSGVCSIDGIDILENPIEAKKRIGFLPEVPPLYPDMTPMEYLNFMYDLKKCTLNRKKHLDEIVSVMRLGGYTDRLISHLSKGYKQRVGIAGALVSNPKVLIFDEPTIGLDPRQIIEIRELIRSLAKNHTIILSTHILPEVQAVCDRIIIIDKGVIKADKATSDINELAESKKRFTIQISGPEPEVESFLRRIEGVGAVEFLSTSKTNGSLFRIQCKTGYDPRRLIFNAMAERQWPIMELNTLGTSLEDIFIALTSKQ